MLVKCRGHTTISAGGLLFDSDFDNGNLRSIEETPRGGYDFQVWTAADNCGTQYESGHSSWFHFSVAGLPKSSTIKFVSILCHPAIYLFELINCVMTSAHDEHQEARWSLPQRHAAGVPQQCDAEQVDADQEVCPDRRGRPTLLRTHHGSRQ